MALANVGWLYMLWQSSHGSRLSTFMGFQKIKLFITIQY